MHWRCVPLFEQNIIMKKITFISLFFVAFSNSFGQSKYIKLNIDSTTKFYLTYYYKSKFNSDYIWNDTVQYVSRKISENKFYLDKLVNKRKEWTRIYSIELASDSMHIKALIRGIRGKAKIQHKVEPYYNSFLVDK